MKQGFTFIGISVLLSVLVLPGRLVYSQIKQATSPQPSPELTPETNGSANTDSVAPNPARNAAFRGVKLTDAKGKQTDAALIFSDINQTVSVRIASRDFVAVPYSQLDKFSYEYTKKHRVTQGAVVMVASLGAGAIVMLTKSKSHWLYMDFHEQNVPRTLVLRMDKHDYKDILGAVKTHTGKEVEFLKDAESGSKKDKRDTQDAQGR